MEAWRPRLACGVTITAAAVAAAGALVACGIEEGPVRTDAGQSSDGPGVGELVCEGRMVDAQYDYDWSDPAFGAERPEDAIATGVEGEWLPAGRDVEVSPAIWHRLDDDGRVVTTFRLGVTPDGEYYLDGYTRCSDA